MGRDVLVRDGFGATSPGTRMVPCWLVLRLYKPKSEAKYVLLALAIKGIIAYQLKLLMVALSVHNENLRLCAIRLFDSMFSTKYMHGITLYVLTVGGNLQTNVGLTDENKQTVYILGNPRNFRIILNTQLLIIAKFLGEKKIHLLDVQDCICVLEFRFHVDS